MTPPSVPPTSSLDLGVWLTIAATLVGAALAAWFTLWWQARRQRKEGEWPFLVFDSFEKLAERYVDTLEVPYAPRETGLADLAESVRSLLIAGPPGVGKSREALEWVRRVMQRQPAGRVKILVPRDLGSLRLRRELRIPDLGSATRLILLLDPLERYEHRDREGLKALGEVRDRLAGLQGVQVTLLGTLRERNLWPDPEEVDGNPWRGNARHELQVGWLSREESKALIIKCIKHYKLDAEESFAESLASESDRQAVSLTGFLREVERDQRLGVTEVTVYRESWMGKELKPLLEPLTQVELVTLAALGVLIRNSLPPFRGLLAPVVENLTPERRFSRWRAAWSTRRGLSRLEAQKLVRIQSGATVPYHDLLAESAAKRLEGSGISTDLDLERLARRFCLARRWTWWHATFTRPGPRQRLDILAAISDRFVERGEALSPDLGTDLYRSAALLAERLKQTSWLVGIWNNWGNALGGLARATLGEDPAAARGLFDEAFEKYRRATDTKPDYDAAWYNWANALGDLARATLGEDPAAARGLFDEAFEKYLRATDAKPDYHQAWYNWGNDLGDLAAATLGENPAAAHGLFDEAFDKYRRATDAKPDYHAAWNNWGNALGDLAGATLSEDATEARRRFDEAFDKYRRATDAKPDLHEAWNNWGTDLGALARATLGEDPAAARGLFEEAFEKYRRATDAKPDYHEAWYNWGTDLGALARATLGEDAAAGRGLFDEAFEKYRRATDAKPDEHEAWNNWGYDLVELARSLNAGEERERLRDDAVEKVRRALRLAPEDCDYMASLGWLLLDSAEAADKGLFWEWKAALCFLAKGDGSSYVRELGQAWSARDRCIEASHLAWGAGLALAVYACLKGQPDVGPTLDDLKAAPEEARNGLWPAAMAYVGDGEVPQDLPVSAHPEVVEQHLADLLRSVPRS